MDNIIMQYMCTLIYIISICKLLDNKLKFNIENALIILGISSILAIATIFDIGLFKGLLRAILIILFLKFETKNSIKEIVISYLIIDIVSVIFEIILGITLKVVTPTIENYYLNHNVYKIFLSMILYTLIYFFAYLVKKINIKIDMSWIYISVISILFFTVATLNYNMVINSNIYLYELFIILILIILFIFIISFKISYKNKHMKQEIENLNEKNNECIKYIDEFKKYKHNLRYDLIAAEQYGNKKINKILNEIINKGDSDIEYINNLKNIPSSLLSIFMDRLSILSNEAYSIVINNDLNNNEINITNSYKYIKMCEITGNILTNAIEALPNNNGILVINFFEVNGDKYLEVVNNFKNEIDIENIGKIKYSTKKRNSGYGLNSILKEKMFEPQISIKNEFFVIKIKIPK